MLAIQVVSLQYLTNPPPAKSFPTKLPWAAVICSNGNLKQA